MRRGVIVLRIFRLQVDHVSFLELFSFGRDCCVHAIQLALEVKCCKWVYLFELESLMFCCLSLKILLWANQIVNLDILEFLFDPWLATISLRIIRIKLWSQWMLAHLGLESFEWALIPIVTAKSSLLSHQVCALTDLILLQYGVIISLSC